MTLLSGSTDLLNSPTGRLVVYAGSVYCLSCLQKARRRVARRSDGGSGGEGGGSSAKAAAEPERILHSDAVSELGMMVVGIAGGSGSGKTTLATAVYEALGTSSCSYIMHDSYYRDMSHLTIKEKALLNFDHPDALDTDLLIEHIKTLKQQKVALIPSYDFATHSRTQKQIAVQPRAVVIVEGILIFTNPELCSLFDLKIFVDTDDDIRLIRRIQRDTVERGRTLGSVIEQYTTTVRPMYHEFVKSSMNNADLIIPHGLNQQAFDCVVARLKSFCVNGYGQRLVALS